MRHLRFWVVVLAASMCSSHVAAADSVSLATRVLTVLLKLSPPERHRPPPGWEETVEEAKSRYASIAADIAAVARTQVEAAVLVGVAFHESGFQRDVDLGPCYQGKGFKGRCDGNRAVSIYQLQDTSLEKRELYRSDRRAATREALSRILRSRKMCSKNEPTEKLAAYAGGSCETAAARKAARGLDAAVRKALSLM